MTTLNAHLLFRAGGAVITVIKERNSLLFFVMQNGLIYQQDVGLFLDIRSRVLYPGLSEMGLLGFTFHPNNNSRFFLWFSEEPNNPPPGFNHINRLEEWRIIAGIPQRQVTLLRIPNPSTIHNGNNNIFYDVLTNRLILATGDGGNSALAQLDNQLHGKLISIDVDNAFWLTNQNNTPVTQVSQLGSFGSVITVVSKGIRNPSRLDQKDGIKFMSVAGQSTREFAFAFRNPNDKNFGWRAFEGPIPTLSGTTVSFPTEVIRLLHQNQIWEPYVHYANAGASGLPPEVFRGNAISGIDLYKGPIATLNNGFIFTDLSGQVFHIHLLQSPFEIVLQLSQPISKINVNNLQGIITTMYITNSGKIYVAHSNTSGFIVTSVSELRP